MRFVILFCTVIFSAVSASAAQCYGDADLIGRKELMAAMRKRDVAQFDKLFENFCTKNASKIICKKENISETESRARQTALVTGHGCAQAMDLTPSSKETTIYFFDQI